MRTFILAVAVLLTTVAGADAKVVGKAVKYKVGTAEYTGYLAYDDAVAGKRPGILVVHEWWGHDDYVEGRARMLARLGYTAFAPDMYGTGKLAKHPKDATAFMTALFSSGEVMARMKAAADVLTASNTVDPKRLGAIGYCMGGALVIDAARNGMPNLKAVASFHGSLAKHGDAKPGAVKAEMLIMYGGADPFIPKKDVDAFENEMNNAGARYTMVSYPGVVHSFTNPSATEKGKEFNMPLRYDPKAEEDSWRRMQILFAQELK